MKQIAYLIISIIVSFLVASALFNGYGGANSPLVRFGDLLISPFFGLILIDPLVYFWKVLIKKQQQPEILSKESLMGILENYFMYWLLFGIARVAYWWFSLLPKLEEIQMLYTTF
jgi:hypothetical protein